MIDTRAKRQDPSTSHEAGIASHGFSENHPKLILAELAKEPLAAFEIAQRTHLDHTQVNRRMGELKKRELIEPTGQKRKTPNGTNALVYRIKTTEWKTFTDNLQHLAEPGESSPKCGVKVKLSEDERALMKCFRCSHG